MLKQYSLDMESSIQLYRKYEGEMKAKECYLNIFHITMHEMNKFKSGEWKIAYGYWLISGNLFTRHCFILTENNEVIDPTLPCSEGKLNHTEHPYYIFKAMNKEEYDSYLEKANYKPCMGDLFFKLEKEIEKHLMSNNTYILTV